MQSAFYDNQYSTLYPEMVYFRSYESIESEAYVIISDYMHRDKYAVFEFNEAIVTSKWNMT